MLAIGQNIASERLKKGITQAQLARAAGVSQPNLSAIEKGRRDMTIATLRRISAALGVSAARLLGEGAPVTRVFALTRPRIERIARLIARPVALGDGEEDRVARLFRQILPAPGAKRRPAKKTLRSWLELRALFDQNQIRSILARIRDEQQRTLNPGT